jgi:hypothetical protein
VSLFKQKSRVSLSLSVSYNAFPSLIANSVGDVSTSFLQALFCSV